MSLIWAICGAGRNVGKTTVALRLCDVLPDSIYAKCGHGPSQPNKPGEYFRRLEDLNSFINSAAGSKAHIVVESNAMAKMSRADIVIFIEGAADKTHFRSDAERLRELSHIKITPDVSVSQWKTVLSDKIGGSAVSDAVCQVLLAQKSFLFDAALHVRSKIWFEASGRHIFGHGLAELLDNVNRLGTLRDAAKALHMSYRYAWNLIRMAEHHFGRVLLERHAGGPYGGRSQLSSEGLRMLQVFNRLNEEVAFFTDKKFAELYGREKIDASR